MNTSVIFQYLLDNIDTDAITLKVKGCNISINKNMSLHAQKSITATTFTLTDPECAEKLLKFIEEPEGPSVKLNMNDWFRIIGQDALTSILNGPGSWKARYDLILEDSFSYDAYSAFDDCDYWVGSSMPEFEEFVIEYMKYNGTE